MSPGPDSSGGEGITIRVSNHVGWITINRPERRNAIDAETAKKLLNIISRCGADDDVRVVALTGSGDKAFCAGADLKELGEMPGQAKSLSSPMLAVERSYHEALLELPKPTVAVLNGAAIGGGCELALGCDIRLAADDIQLGLPEAKRGLGANFASVLLPTVVPRGVALELLYTGRSISAQEALRIGLVNSVHSRDELVHSAEDLLQTIAQNAPLSVRRYKEMALKSWGLPYSTGLRLNVGPNPYASKDREEGVRAFNEKRRPEWIGQ